MTEQQERELVDRLEARVEAHIWHMTQIKKSHDFHRAVSCRDENALKRYRPFSGSGFLK